MDLCIAYPYFSFFFEIGADGLLKQSHEVAAVKLIALLILFNLQLEEFRAFNYLIGSAIGTLLLSGIVCYIVFARIDRFAIVVAAAQAYLYYYTYTHSLLYFGVFACACFAISLTAVHFFVIDKVYDTLAQTLRLVRILTCLVLAGTLTCSLQLNIGVLAVWLIWWFWYRNNDPEDLYPRRAPLQTAAEYQAGNRKKEAVAKLVHTPAFRNWIQEKYWLERDAMDEFVDHNLQ